MKKPTNLIKHFLIGYIAGIVCGILSHNINPFSQTVWAILCTLGFLGITFGWEWLQYKLSNLSYEDYLAYKRTDTVWDLIIGNISFLVPMWVISCGIYAGSVLRP